jgi:class 3 adenylate cyclase
MVRLQVQGFARAGNLRRFQHGYTTVVQLGDTVVGYGVYEPGFRWSSDLAGLAGTPTCLLDHVGYALSGVLHVLTDDGQESDIREHSVYEIPPGHDAWVVGDEPFVSVDWASARAWKPVDEGDGDGVIVTILLSDIVESTPTVHRVGDEAWRVRLARHHARMRELLNSYQGREVKTTGDGLLAVFDRPVRAVRCAQAMVAASRGLELPIRVGVHTGEVQLFGGDAQGLAVHTVARVTSIGGADDVLVTATTRDLLEGSGLELEDAGEHELRGIPGVRSLFRLDRT